MIENTCHDDVFPHKFRTEKHLACSSNLVLRKLSPRAWQKSKNFEGHRGTHNH